MASKNGGGYTGPRAVSGGSGGGIGGMLAGQLGLIIVAIVIAIGAYSSYYQVESDQVALVTRFGHYVYTAQPGPHFRWPFGIEGVIKVPVQRQLKDEFGFRTVHADVRTEYQETDESRREARMLTGDLNVADVEWIVQYKVKNPYDYVFRVRDVHNTLRDLSESVMRSVVGDHSVTEVLTVGREQIQMMAKDRLQALCNRYQMGIEILQLVLQDVNPPQAVRESFNEVNQAIQERERAVNQAWAAYNSVVPEAQGKAAQAIQSAEGYATERVNDARGDVARFNALLTEYAKAPAVTRTRLYLEAIAKVLPATRHRVFIDDKIKGVLPLLGLQEGGKP